MVNTMSALWPMGQLSPVAHNCVFYFLNNRRSLALRIGILTRNRFRRQRRDLILLLCLLLVYRNAACLLFALSRKDLQLCTWLQRGVTVTV